MKNEIWKNIKDFNNIYQVSNYGRIRGINRLVNSKSNSYKVVKGQLRVCIKGNCGYLRVSLSKNNYNKYYSVHRLVAMAFIINDDNKSTVNHKDGNKLNNNLDNLEWMTKSENILHGLKNRLIPTGEKRKDSKLTLKNVKYIRNSRENGAYLAKKFNVSQSLISRIKKFITWRYA